MNTRINRILDSEQITQILGTFLINRPVSIIRVISKTGKNASSVPWVYYSNDLTQERFASSLVRIRQKF